MPSLTDTTRVAPAPTRRRRAKALFAKLRDRQLRSALSGRVLESAVYAQRARRVRQVGCGCSL